MVVAPWQELERRCNSVIRIRCRAPGWGRCWRWPLGADCGAGRRADPGRGEGRRNAGAKIVALVAGMVAGADCIDDMDLLHPKTGDRSLGVESRM